MVYPTIDPLEEWEMRQEALESVRGAWPTPVRCAGCGARLADRLGDLVVVRVRVRAGQTKRVVGREVEITCSCGAVWRSKAR
jgi:transposase